MLKKCLQNRNFVISLVVLLPLVIIALIGPFIIPYDPLEIDGSMILKASTPDHLLGTDNFGRDILSRLIMGIRPTLIIALVSTAFAFLAGLIIGTIGGYCGKIAEQITMRFADMILCFPPILLALMVVAFWGPGVVNLIIAMSILFTPQFARLAYSSTKKVKELEYVESEIALGSSPVRIMRKCIIPNIMAPLIVQISLTIASAILLESGLSFLGIGIVPPTPSWGQMIGEAKGYISIMPMYAFWPSLCLFVTILAVNLLGDSLRDILDPRLNSNM
jgi:peptide/nickel transport system permease protein